MAVSSVRQGQTASEPMADPLGAGMAGGVVDRQPFKSAGRAKDAAMEQEAANAGA